MRGQMVELDADTPPTYDELFSKSMTEDDDNLPCYEVACETEAQPSAASKDAMVMAFLSWE